MKKTKSIIGLIMGVMLTFGMAVTAFAGTKDVTGTYLKLHISATSNSGTTTCSDRGSGRWVNAWHNCYNAAGTKIGFSQNTSVTAVTAVSSGLSGNAWVTGSGQIRKEAHPNSQLLETRPATANV